MKNRGIVSVVLLSIFTFGIYAIYWFYVTANALNEADKEEKPLMNFILALVLSCITFGIYGIYWEYKFCKKADKVLGKDNAILAFILCLFLTPVAMAIEQSAINEKIGA